MQGFECIHFALSEFVRRPFGLHLHGLRDLHHGVDAASRLEGPNRLKRVFSVLFFFFFFFFFSAGAGEKRGRARIQGLVLKGKPLSKDGITSDTLVSGCFQWVVGIGSFAALGSWRQEQYTRDVTDFHITMPPDPNDLPLGLKV